MIDGALGELSFERDAEHRLDVARIDVVDDVHDPAEVVLQRPNGGEAVERPHDKERVTHPAIAIVPVAGAVRRFGNAGGHGGDDRAGRLVGAHLERDGGADHRLLPFDRYGQPVNPGAPVIRRVLEERLRHFRRTFRQRLVRSEDQVNGLGHLERGLFEQIVDRRIRRQPHGELVADKTDVIGAIGHGRRLRAVVEAWAQPDLHPRVALDRHDLADQHLRPECAVAGFEPRTEVGNLDAAGFSAQRGLQDRGVGDIALNGAGLIFDLDRKDAVVRRRLGMTKQGLKNRIAVEARQATPDHPRLAIDERADAAISDQSKIKALQWSVTFRALPAAAATMPGIHRSRRHDTSHWCRRGRL